MPADPERVQTVFTKAADLSPGGRAALLDSECRNDLELRGRVQALLAAHDAPASLFQRPPSGIADPLAMAIRPVPDITEGPGAAIGPYTLLEKIGEGGFGVVFLAEQERPVRRSVALKVIKPGMDSRQVLRRFEAERQALALMDHTNIANIFDAGTSPDGRPYFAMELVKGVQITRYCDDHALTVRDRLELFVPVCHALQHAHQKGVIHRDVKPSNVLVCVEDGKAVPKVIDFGVAKALHQPPADRTTLTEAGALIGTLEYMAPEQANLAALDVDTRADVYALGAMLYELLTGSTPVARKRLATADFVEVHRIIRDEEPSKPSVRLTESQEELSTIAVQRRTDAVRLRSEVRGDLDRIVMKCLEKDRARRYETAEALARDVERHLADEPIDAREPSRSYRLRKFARRNRGTLAATSLVALALLAGTAVAGWQAVRATKAQKLAEQRSEQIRLDLGRLKTANVLVERGRRNRENIRWDDAEADLSKAVALRPDQLVGWTERHELYVKLGLWDLASADLSRALQIREPDASFDWYLQSILRMQNGDVKGYRELRERMRDRFRGDLAPSSQIDVVRTSVLAPWTQSDAAAVAAMARRLMTSRNQDDWFSPYFLGLANYRSADYSRAAELLQDSTERGPPLGAMGYPCLAMARHRLGQAGEARAALAAASATIDQWTEGAFAADRNELWVTRGGAAPVLPVAWWDWLEFQVYFREATLLIHGAPPDDDARLHVLRARAFAGLHRMREAESEYHQALRLRPDDTLILFEASRDRGATLAESGRFQEAVAEFARATELRPDDVRVWRFRAMAHFAAGDMEAYRACCEALIERFGETDDSAIACNVGSACTLGTGALRDNDRLLRIAEVAAPEWHFGTFVRGAALYRAGRHVEAVEWLEAAARIYPPRAWDWAFLAMARQKLGQADEARRCLAEASRWISEANRRDENGGTGTGPAWGSYYERVVYPLLVREAEHQIKTPARP